MKICAECPMNDDRYESSNQADKRTIQDLRIAMNRKDDFVEWLFEHSEHCDHIPYSEAWKEFELWEEASYLKDAPDDVVKTGRASDDKTKSLKAT